MTRQNALPTPSTGLIQPVEVISLITARQEKESRSKRDRTWEKSNPANSYRIPADLRIQAKDISANLVSIAAEYLTTISSVAAALMAFSLSHLRSGKLEIEVRPKAERKEILVRCMRSGRM